MSEPIRVLHVLGKLHRGGAETMVMNLYRQIDRSKIQFDFVVHNLEEEDYEAEILSLGGKIHRVPQYKGINHLKYVISWYELLKMHPEYQIIHGHVRSTAAIYLKICKKMKRKTISHSHNISSGEGISAIVKDIYQLPIRFTSDYFLAPSIKAGEWLFGKNILRNSNFFIFNNSIDTRDFKYNKEIRKDYRDKLKLEDELLLGHVGRFHTQKNHLFLIDIFHEVVKKRKNSKLLLIGNGEEYEKVMFKIKEKKLENSVIHFKSSSDISKYMQAMDIFVFPSFYEGLGIVAIESQAAGLPTLVSENIPIEAFLTNCIIEEKIASGPHEWAEKIISMTKDTTDRQDTTETIKKNGYDIVENTAWLEKFYQNIYKELVS